MRSTTAGTTRRCPRCSWCPAWGSTPTSTPGSWIRGVIVDVRGRGRSDVPDTGYRWEDHIGDLHAVVEATGLDHPIVVAFSRGSSYALGFALEHPDELRGLVIGDYFARHVGLPAEFA